MSLEKQLWTMVKSFQKCISSRRVLPFSTIRRVWLLLSSSLSILSSVSTNWCSTSDLTLSSRLEAKRTTSSKRPSKIEPLSSVCPRKSSKTSSSCSPSPRLWFKKEPSKEEEFSWTILKSWRSSLQSRRRRWRLFKRRDFMLRNNRKSTRKFNTRELKESLKAI